MSSSENSRGANWLAGLEVLVIFLLIVIYIWRLRFRHPYSWMPILLLVFASHLYHRETLGALGLGWKNLRRDFAAISVVLALPALGLLASGLMFHTIREVSWLGAVSSFALYCCWGLFQQCLLNAYFVNRCSAFLPGSRHATVPLVVGTLFSVVHLPNWFLMLVALPGGYLCARFYVKHRNLYPLALAHGVIGFLIYLTVPDTISHHLYVGPKWFSM
jgi:hypothetical protein